MNVTENKARIFMRKVGKGKKAFTRFSVSISRKDEDGDYINATLFANLSDSAKQAIRDEACGTIERGDGYSYIDCAITEGWLSARAARDDDEYNMVVLFINELEPREDEPDEKPKRKTSKKKAPAKKRPSEDDEDEEEEEDLPF